MLYIFKRIYFLLIKIGINPVSTWKTIIGLPFFIRDIIIFNRQKYHSNESKYFSFGLPYPVLDERFKEGGIANGHYFHQDLLVAQRIFEVDPVVHLDIGSRVDGFVAHVASFRNIEVLDLRETRANLENISFKVADLMNFDKSLSNYCDSLSCLHALEHFGLGRYNDPIKFDGYLDGLDSMYQILKKGGKFYLSVPIGKQRVEFNAHRVFSIRYLLELFQGKYLVDFFSFVDDKGNFYKHVELKNEAINKNFDCEYGCGIFEMTKL
jgi:SAM-dependent methyltransferase